MRNNFIKPSYPKPAAPRPPPKASRQLRDYFAAKAMNGFLANSDTTMVPAENTADESIQLCAEASYKIADAMLLERAK